MSENHFWGVQKISGPMGRLLETQPAFEDMLRNKLARAQADIAWEFEDEFANAHLGPRLGPGRAELSDARQRIWQDEHFRSFGRPAGPYRR